MSVSSKHPVIVAVVGMAGAGKSEVVKFFEAREFGRVYFGDTTLRIVEERKLPKGEQHERHVREELRRKHGMAAFAKLNEAEIRRLVTEGQDVVIDGLYSWDELTYLWEEFPNQLYVVAVVADKKLRYERLSMRPNRPLSPEEARLRDIAEIEKSAKGGPIAMADFTVTNNGTLEHLHEKLANGPYYQIKHE
jgi:dephospho-CoA kinase